MQNGKPNPRLSEVIEARARMQQDIASAVRLAIADFSQTTGMVVTSVTVETVVHTTKGVPDFVLVKDVQTTLAGY